jgi:hypothetical protein
MGQFPQEFFNQIKKSFEADDGKQLLPNQL